MRHVRIFIVVPLLRFACRAGAVAHSVLDAAVPQKAGMVCTGRPAQVGCSVHVSELACMACLVRRRSEVRLQPGRLATCVLIAICGTQLRVQLSVAAAAPPPPHSSADIMARGACVKQKGGGVVAKAPKKIGVKKGAGATPKVVDEQSAFCRKEVLWNMRDKRQLETTGKKGCRRFRVRR